MTAIRVHSAIDDVMGESFAADSGPALAVVPATVHGAATTNVSYRKIVRLRREKRNLRLRVPRRDATNLEQDKEKKELKTTQDLSMVPFCGAVRKTPLFRQLHVALKRCSGHASLRSTSTMLGLNVPPGLSHISMIFDAFLGYSSSRNLIKTANRTRAVILTGI